MLVATSSVSRSLGGCFRELRGLRLVPVFSLAGLQSPKFSMVAIVRFSMAQEQDNSCTQWNRPKKLPIPKHIVHIIGRHGRINKHKAKDFSFLTSFLNNHITSYHIIVPYFHLTLHILILKKLQKKTKTSINNTTNLLHMVPVTARIAVLLHHHMKKTHHNPWTQKRNCQLFQNCSSNFKLIKPI